MTHQLAIELPATGTKLEKKLQDNLTTNQDQPLFQKCI